MLKDNFSQIGNILGGTYGLYRCHGKTSFR